MKKTYSTPFVTASDVVRETTTGSKTSQPNEVMILSRTGALGFGL